MSSAIALQRKSATYDDLLELPEYVIGEIIEGQLIASPRPAGNHALSYSNLGGDLNFFFGRSRNGSNRPGGWWIISEPEIHLGEDVLVPDLAGWRRERLPEYSASASSSLAPDWVCEILSPKSGGIDRVKKSHIYAREQIPHFWIVDPEQHTLEVYELKEGFWRMLESWQGKEKVRAKPFEAVELNLADWWLESTIQT